MTLHTGQARASGHDGSPMFLRNADRWREDRIAGELCRRWRVHLWHLPALSVVDFLAVRDGRPCGWVEVISRNRTMAELDELGGVALKADTFAALMALGAVPLSTDWAGARVVWDLRDGLYYATINADTPALRSTISDPRGAANDTEPVMLLGGLRPVPQP